MTRDTTAHQMPQRTGMKFLIAPWEIRHLRAFARVRFVAGALLLVAIPVLLINGWGAASEPWLAVIIAVAAVGNFSFGYWELTIARSVAARD
jgi:hypothetical protein